MQELKVKVFAMVALSLLRTGQGLPKEQSMR